MSRQITPQRTGTARELLDAYARGMGAHYRSTSALSVTADVCRSYSEPIGCFDYRNAPGTVFVSDACTAHGGTPFSVTTSKHIGQLVRALEATGTPYQVIDHDTLRGIARGH